MIYVDSSFIYSDDVFIDDYYMDEKWTYIQGFPGYMISDKARVWSSKSQKFLTIKPMDDHGHLGVCLYKDGKNYYKYIHRLVAEAFIPNPDHLPIVRHINDDPSLNTTEDLIWGTQKDNIHDAIRNGNAYVLTNEDRYKANAPRMTPVIAINIDTGEKSHYTSQGECSRQLHIPQANIFKVLSGERKHAGGYIFIKEVSHE